MDFPENICFRENANARQKEKTLFSHKFIFAKFSRKEKDLGDFRKYENAVVKHGPEKGRIFYAIYIK